MKIILLSGSIYAIPSLHFLAGQNMIEAVVSVGDVNKYNMQLEQASKHMNIPFVRLNKDQLLTDFKKMLLETSPDVVLVFGLGCKVPSELFKIPKKGFYNVHFSLLPAYRGHSPVFWQLKNGETTGGVTIHKINEKFDDGPILAQQAVTIFPGDSYGIFSARLGIESTMLVGNAMMQLNMPGEVVLTEQDREKISYGPAPLLNDLKIHWETQTAKEIECLVNASNPDYGGAITLLRGQPIHILEVNMALLNNPNPEGVTSGTIVHSDPNYGIFVACINSEYLRLNILQSHEGILSGFKLAGMGVMPGEKFDTVPETADFTAI
ncbi:formyltransferase family protein [uncultured Mucilaginibacter sp.]|uniref:methionyl-tRNA formyltransferase n=1 Tax=uncultured Mucilaginibacter sp. TaxID=797541 RepID=UPI0025EB9611|nr:formyltransferase family protein [uncultured Mucilaginibacter sp.]